MGPDGTTLRNAFAQTWADVDTVCSDLTPEQWATPTALPGWSVQDNVSHVVGEELLMLGEPEPVHELPADLPHVRHEFARQVEVAIDMRRSRPGAEVLAELRDVAGRRLAVLSAYDEATFDAEGPFAGRTMSLRNALGIRLFDCWTHEQDIRRALGRPGGFDNPAADLTRRRLLRALSGLAEDVPAAAGKTVVIETTDELPGVGTLRLGDEPSYEDSDATAPDVRMTMSFDTFHRLTTGRVSYDDIADAVALDGDAELGATLARKFAVTP